MINKVYYGSRILIDLTTDTVSESTLLRGYTAHSKDGYKIEGTCPFDVDSSDATATPDKILAEYTAYVKGEKITGTIPNIGTILEKIDERDQKVELSEGFYNGGTILIEKSEREKLVPGNIKSGVTILGVTGTLEEAQLTEFPPVLVFTDTIEDENGASILDQNNDPLLGAYVYKKI